MIDYGLRGKVALITGANNPWGIGAATAIAFAREGARVVLIYKRVDRPFNPDKTDRNGVDRYYGANAGNAVTNDYFCHPTTSIKRPLSDCSNTIGDVYPL